MTKHSKNVEYSSVSSESNQMIELYEKAELLQEEGNSSKAISMLEEALEISLEIENWEYQFNCYYTIARSHLALGNFKNALNSIEGALNVAELHLSQNKEKLSLANNATGVIYYSQNNMELALDYFMKALQFKIEENKLKIYNNLGNTHSFSGNHEKAQEYYNLALIEAQDKEDDYMTATLLLNTSKSLAHYNQFDKAKENNQNALTLTDKHLESDQRFFYLKFYILLNLVEIYISEGDFDKATKTTDEVILTAKSGPLHECYCRALYHIFH